jgi:hypothetical protein
MQGLIDDLRYAQAAGVMVTLGAPEAYQDTTTTQKVALDLVRSVAVTDISAGLDRPFL